MLSFLITGAGAVQMSGLKTISTRNLALSSRCLQLVRFHLPLLRDHFELLLQSKSHNSNSSGSALPQLNINVAKYTDSLIKVSCVHRWHMMS